MSITKADLADDLYRTVGLSKSDSIYIVEYFFGAITDSLVKNRAVKLAGFGRFVCRDKCERPGRNPKTKDPAPIAARRVVIYKPSQKIKDRLKDINPKFVETPKRRHGVEDLSD